MIARFTGRLAERWAEGKFICVGLDADTGRLPKSLATTSDDVSPQAAFNREIIDATKDLVCAYKANAAFYEAEGARGLAVLEATVAHVHEVAPGVPLILDAKRADIGNTNGGYVRYAFDLLGADAITVHPYLGAEAMQPFLDRADRGIIVLCRTSNPGAAEFQDLTVAEPGSVERTPLFARVARNVATTWNGNGNCALVVGATYPAELAAVRRIAGDLPILIPGIGAQGGDLEATVRAGADSNGRGMIINNGRDVIFASDGEDFAGAARAAVIRMQHAIDAVVAAA